MRDFTLKAYSRYLDAIKKSYPLILRFDRFFKFDHQPESFCLIRHDVDRKPQNALKMAKLEHAANITSTYFFRTRKHTLDAKIISAIAALGHEIGYHYESLSDTKGNMQRAIENFESNLQRLRNITPISTICMHGRPLSAHDNKALWEIAEHHEKLIHQYLLLGEVYLDIDYADIAYISDTGRNWKTQKANRRDRVKSNISLDFSNGQSLLNYLNNQPHRKLVFLAHPERWADNYFDYAVQYSIDTFANLIKTLI
jgi:hypothetical protein